MPRRRTPLLAVAGTAVALTAPAPALANTSQYTIFEAPTEMASADAGLRAQTFGEIQSLGATHIRVLVYWNSVVRDNEARKKPAGFDERDHTSGAYDWSRYDRVFSEAAQRGVQVVATLTGPVPTWATGPKKGHTKKPVPWRFKRFVQAAGTRYGSQVSTWTVWNEPNHPDFLTPQFKKGKPYSPKRYRALYKKAVKGLEASGNGGDTILAGETAPRGTPRVVAPVTFAKKFFKGKKIRVDGYAHHPYTTKSGPFFKPDDRKDVTIGVLGRLTRALDRHSKHRRLGLYLTEFGIQSKPDPYVGVGERKQAEFRSIAEHIAYRNRRVKAFSQYLMRDDQPRPGDKYARYSGFESGLRHSDGRAKQAYKGFRLPLVADRASKRRVKLWGLVRPAAGKTRVVLQKRDRKGGWRKLKTKATNSRGYFSTRTKFVKKRKYRVAWDAPDGTRFKGPKTRVYRAP